MNIDKIHSFIQAIFLSGSAAVFSLKKNSRTMNYFKIHLIVGIQIIFYILSHATILKRKITVMISSTPEPFVFSGNQTGIDISILDSFAKQFDFEINFIQSNESLLEMFASDNSTEVYLKRHRNA